MCVNNNLPGVAARQCNGRESNLRPLDQESDALPLHHRTTLNTSSMVRNGEVFPGANWGGGLGERCELSQNVPGKRGFRFVFRV